MKNKLEIIAEIESLIEDLKINLENLLFEDIEDVYSIEKISYVDQIVENFKKDEEPEKKKFYGYVRSPAYWGGFQVKRVSKYQLGHNVLGRAWIYSGLIEIASDLYGNQFQEVLLHETLHMKHPEKSEGEIRSLTRTTLPFSPNFH